METGNIPIPTLLVDFKKCRIRLPWQTLQLLGSPGFFRLLVNPKRRVIALQICDASDIRAHHGKKNGRALELYSRSLLRQLLLCGSWNDLEVYKLSGVLAPENGIILFQIEDAASLSPQQSDEKAR